MQALRRSFHDRVRQWAKKWVASLPSPGWYQNKLDVLPGTKGLEIFDLLLRRKQRLIANSHTAGSPLKNRSGRQTAEKLLQRNNRLETSVADHENKFRRIRIKDVD